MVELSIEHEGVLHQPAVESGLKCTTQRRGAPGKLAFTLHRDEALRFGEGSPVRLVVEGHAMFYGFIFTRKQDKTSLVQVTAYDQLRYLKNKDTRVWGAEVDGVATAGAFIASLAEDYRLNLGDIAPTGHTVASRVEDNTTLLDMVDNALDLELMHRGQMYVLYDDFGALTLKPIQDMVIPDLLLDADTGEDFDYTVTIDDGTYNQIKLSRENEDTGKRDIYLAKSSENINRWGVLQYFDSIGDEANGQARADSLLALYNAPTRRLKLRNFAGDPRVRAGAMVYVALDLGGERVNNRMLVEECVHEIGESEHRMTLTLRGGIING